MRLYNILSHRYRGQRVYVSADLLVFYVEGNPKKFIVPDVFVVKNCAPGFRRNYRIWEEGQPPHAIFEVTSRSSKREDTKTKPALYAIMGVGEYFLVDPSVEYLGPPLQGFRLEAGRYVRIEPNEQGQLVSQELEITLELDGVTLVLRDAKTGDELLTADEDAEATWKDEEAKRKDAEARNAELN
jgi:Uma2 family endonuclease